MCLCQPQLHLLALPLVFAEAAMLTTAVLGLAAAAAAALTVWLLPVQHRCSKGLYSSKDQAFAFPSVAVVAVLPAVCLRGGRH